MLVKMNRFFTNAEIERLYGIPAAVLPSVMARVPVVHRDNTGEPQFTEKDVDRAVDDYAASVTGRQISTCDPAPKGKPGRRPKTSDIAVVINDMKAMGKTWKEIGTACKSQFPERITNHEQVRTIWRRHFRGKK